MRILILMRGAPGSGKSTWIEQNGLKPYTLAPDELRLLCQSPILRADGTRAISQENETVVWKILFELLETRMSRGELTVIDATNSKTSEMSRYRKLCETYRYRIYCVDFTEVALEEVKRRNAAREMIKRVPEDVVDRMYSRCAAQRVPSGIKVIRPEELDRIWLKRIDLSEYSTIHHIGDIHGCYTVLKRYLDENGGIREDEFYIFLGDYIDRGIENAEVVRFLLSIRDRRNVLLLEGNHEKWLKTYSHDEVGGSAEFETVTRPQLEQAAIAKKDIRQLVRRLGQCAYYRYDDKVVLVTHAGLSTLPDNLSFVAAGQMIRGVGGYQDAEQIAETFFDTTPENVYQIHGHRNIRQLPVEVNDRVFNLEGQVEFGGCLRCVQISHDGIRTVETENEVYKEPVIDRDALPQDICTLRKMFYEEEEQYVQQS